jgi:hypothetical protein
MATFIHNKARAKKSRDWIEETKANGAECCIALAHLGKDNTPVAIVMPSGLGGLTKKLKTMDYEGKPKSIDAKKEKDFNVIALGLATLDQNNILNVRLKKGSAESLNKGLKKYFKIGFGIEVPYDSIAPETNLPEDQENLFAQTEAENQQKFSSEEGEADQQAVAAEPPMPSAPVEEPDTEASSPILAPEASDAGDEDVADEDPTEDVKESDSEDSDSEDEEDDNALSDELKTGIAAESAKIAAHALGLSRQIGAGQKAEQDPLMGKIADWLADMLAATPLEDRETALHNFTSRLLLMLAYPENLRNLQYVDASQTGDRWKKRGADAKVDADREKTLVNGIDLDSVPTDDLDQTEVTEALVNLAKAQAKERLLPYPVSQVRPEETPIATIVASGWPKQEGQAAARRQVIERLIAAMKQKFGTDDQLIGLLGFKKGNPAQGDELVASLVDSIRDVWEARRGTAIKQTDELKRKVNQIVKVEALGGTWRHVDELFLRIDGEISNQLSAIGGQDGEARSKAIELVAGTVESSLGYLDSNPIVGLLDNPPFDAGQGAVGETLREALDGVSKGLKRIESSGAAAGA